MLYTILGADGVIVNKIAKNINNQRIYVLVKEMVNKYKCGRW